MSPACYSPAMSPGFWAFIFLLVGTVVFLQIADPINRNFKFKICKADGFERSWHYTNNITKNPWYKLDFVVPICSQCNINILPQILSNVDSKGPSYAYGIDPVFDVVPKALATRSIRLEDAVSHLRARHLLPKSGGFVINLGAAGSLHGYSDPTWGLLHSDASIGALLLDGQSDSKFFNGYPLTRAGVNLKHSTRIGVESIVQLCQTNAVPANITLLKVDIDSWDLGVIQALLVFRPALIHMEINTNFPPPLRFTIPLDMTTTEADMYAPELWKGASFFYGASLSAAADTLVPQGYTLLEVDGWDATWIRNDMAAAFADLLPKSLEHAFYRGFISFGDKSPSCFYNNPKLWNVKLFGLSKSVTTALAANDNDAVEQTYKILQDLVSSEAPKHKETGNPMRFVLNVTGHAGNHIGYYSL